MNCNTIIDYYISHQLHCKFFEYLMVTYYVVGRYLQSTLNVNRSSEQSIDNIVNIFLFTNNHRKYMTL